MANFRIEPARIEDCGVILSFIRDLAEYERLLDQVVATEDDVRRELFGEKMVVYPSQRQKPLESVYALRSVLDGTTQRTTLPL